VIDVLIIGSGPAGYTAAIYAARAGRVSQLIAGPQPGGQLTTTSFIENYPGFAKPLSGSELMENMRQQAENVGAKIVYDTITSVDFSNKPFVCYGESAEFYVSKSVIIATGAQAKWLGVPGEKKYRGVGVSSCATCDGFFFKNKEVAVVGGGNTAVEEAIYLAKFAKNVTLIHRRDQLRAEKVMQTRLMENPKINVVWNTKVIDILGNGERVTQLLLSDANGEAMSKPIDGVFVAIGHGPVTDVFRSKLDLDSNGYIRVFSKSNTSTKAGVQTSITGVFAAGDVCDPHYKQAITSAGQGCVAAIEADLFLSATAESY
jgi:thioredoxin reductase (NADPH)